MTLEEALERITKLENMIRELKIHEPYPYSPRIERLYQEVEEE